MKILDIDRDTLLKPLQAVSGIVERRHTLPILSNVLIETDGSTVKFLATDLEIQIATDAKLEKPGNRQALTVSARKLQDILRSLPEGTRVTLDATDAKLVVKAGKSRFNLQTLPAQDYPRLAEAAKEGDSLRLPQKQLKAMLQLVQYAMAQQDIRYYLNGLLLVVEKGTLTMVATDGHRLAYMTSGIDSGQEKAELIVPRKAVLELVKLLADSDEPVRVELGAGQVRFAFAGIDLVSKVIDGKFPDYGRVIPAGYKKHITMARVSLLQALQRASILSNEKFRGVRWVLSDNSLKIICTNAEQEEAEEELEVQYAGDALDVGFNISYLLDVLNNLAAEQVDCALGDANSSMLMTVPGEKAFKYVVMPMRI
jgi:DNA polymerase-3 subunit beta